MKFTDLGPKTRKTYRLSNLSHILEWLEREKRKEAEVLAKERSMPPPKPEPMTVWATEDFELWAGTFTLEHSTLARPFEEREVDVGSDDEIAILTVLKFHGMGPLKKGVYAYQKQTEAGIKTMLKKYADAHGGKEPFVLGVDVPQAAIDPIIGTANAFIDDTPREPRAYPIEAVSFKRRRGNSADIAATIGRQG